MSKPDSNSLDELQRWLQGHVQAGANGDIFAFGNQGPPALDPDSKTSWDFEFDVPIGPVIIQFRGSINLSDYSVILEIFVKVPIIPAVLLAKVSGNLNDGVEIQVNLATVISGSLKLYITASGDPSRNWVTLDFSLKIFGSDHSITGFLMFPLPDLDDGSTSSESGDT